MTRTMLVLFYLVSILISPFKSKSRLEAENLALRHQVMVLRRQVGGRVHLTNFDRLFLVQLYHWFPSIRRVLVIAQQLWRRRHAPNSRHGHPGQTHRTSVALAERFCRTVDRINPARVCGSSRGLGRGAFAPDLASVCSLLQQHQNAPVIRQRYAGLSLCSAGRNYHVIRNPRRTSSPLRSDLGFRYTQASAAARLHGRRSSRPLLLRSRDLRRACLPHTSPGRQPSHIRATRKRPDVCATSDHLPLCQRIFTGAGPLPPAGLTIHCAEN
jgi:hypothetical protein